MKQFRRIAFGIFYLSMAIISLAIILNALQ